MTDATDGRIITGIKCLDTFTKSLKRVKDPQRSREVKTTIGGLLLQSLDSLPAKLHFHQLTHKKVPSVLKKDLKVNAWSLHATADDKLKASFTFEDGTVYLRLVDEHDVIDDNP